MDGRTQSINKEGGDGMLEVIKHDDGSYTVNGKLFFNEQMANEYAYTHALLKDVKRGEFFRLREHGATFIRGHYDHASKKYHAFEFEDVNHEIARRGELEVIVNFTF